MATSSVATTVATSSAPPSLCTYTCVCRYEAQNKNKWNDPTVSGPGCCPNVVCPPMNRDPNDKDEILNVRTICSAACQF
jgi:hypothetical protein